MESGYKISRKKWKYLSFKGDKIRNCKSGCDNNPWDSGLGRRWRRGSGATEGGQRDSTNWDFWVVEGLSAAEEDEDIMETVKSG